LFIPSAEHSLVQHLVDLSDWLKSHGLKGQVAFVLCCDVWIVCLMPTTPLELMCAFTFGFWRGLVLNQIAKWTGSVASFLVGRTFASGLVRKHLLKDGSMQTMFLALNDALATDSFRTLMLIQLALMPIAVKNYGLSLAEVSFPLFALTAFLGEMPTTVAVAWTGSSARDLVALFDREDGLSSAELAVLCCSTFFLIISVVLLGRAMTSSLNKLKMSKDGLSSPRTHAMLKKLEGGQGMDGDFEELKQAGKPLRAFAQGSHFEVQHAPRAHGEPEAYEKVARMV
jgi:uncharacterized membrane protein YdjX (TVP38/TMEM64 family)